MLTIKGVKLQKHNQYSLSSVTLFFLIRLKSSSEENTSYNREHKMQRQKIGQNHHKV